MKKKSISQSLICSFCGKNNDEVIKLIAGNSANICDECIELCHGLLQNEVKAEDHSEEVIDTYIESEINVRLISLISNSNSDGWIRDYGVELSWTYPDGTNVISSAIEHDDVGSWLETYDELSEKIVSDIDGVDFSDSDIEEILDRHGNLLEFNFVLYFKGDVITYHYIQCGEGNEVARTITIPTSAINNNIDDWISNAIEKEWCVTLSE